MGSTIQILGIELTVAQVAFAIGALSLVAGFLIGRRFPPKTRDAKVRGQKGKAEKRRYEDSRRAFRRGFQYLLSDDPDQAISQFIRAAKIDSETIETYVALGNLFRRRGELDRAIQIRQALILRPDVDEEVRVQARVELGVDFKRAGLLDRARRAFEQVTEMNPERVDAHLELAEVYEEMKDWDRAFATHSKVDELTGDKRPNVLAHMKCEKAKSLASMGMTKEAEQEFEASIELWPRCMDAYLHLGDLYLFQGRNEDAARIWASACRAVPEFRWLAVERIEAAAAGHPDQGPPGFGLTQDDDPQTDPLTMLALARRRAEEGDPTGARDIIERVLEREPGLVEAHQALFDLMKGRAGQDNLHRAYEKMLDFMAKNRVRFRCAACGYQSSDLRWNCPRCLSWDTMSRIEARGDLS